MKHRLITALLTSLAVAFLPIPMGLWLLPPESGMGFFIFLFLFIYPTLFVFLGSYLARYWKGLWWVVIAAGLAIILAGRVILETWDLSCYLPIYFTLGYGVMAVSALFSRHGKLQREKDIMDLHDL